MSLVSPLASHRGLYIRCHTGDIDEEPENPNMWVSFLQEADDDELNDNEQLIIIPDSAGKGYADVLKGINPSLSNFGEVTQQTQPPVFKESTTQDKMIQYQTGTFVTNCLKGKQDFSKGAEEFNKRLLEDLYLNFRKNDDGTLEMYNKDFLKRQKQVFGWIMKSFGSAILSGKSLTAISLPVIIFKSCSALEQEANCFLRAPHLLERAGTTRDITEQFKLTVAHHVSSLHLFLGVGKPFNPVVGETFQGIIGGCPIYLEQTVHHPPTSAMLMVGKNFTISALTEAVVNMNMSLFKLCRVGHQKVSFKNTNVTIRAQLPPLRAHGSLGKKTMDYGNKLYIFDVANRLYAEIVFDYEEPSLFKKSKVTQQDHFSGSIWRVNDKFAEILSHLPKKAHELDEIKFKEKDHAVELVAKLEGLWLEYLRIGEKVYWTMNDAFPYKMQYFDNPLPSDSNFRMDVLHLRQGDEGKAQETKEKIEEVQRKDKKLREKHKKSHK